ncbi:L-threonylcarbamoyladenylate synthase [Gammaproteobacteria bacterium]|jgi:tRNA threonylcarbamoyl adenosine modification protein (Sua5/YciO/YrdC/YwlC family)|nr:L-threonylcarbamoyladenylate synthase [Gammaproteobacteria bacterium]
MTKVISLHPITPQKHKIHVIAVAILKGQVIASPTDTGYALIGKMEDISIIKRFQQIRDDKKNDHYTVMCNQIRTIAKYAELNNQVFQLIKNNIPNPTVFILPASKKIPINILQEKKKSSIGFRVPRHPILQSIIAELENQDPNQNAILSISVDSYEESSKRYTAQYASEVIEKLSNRVDLVIDSEPCLRHHSTILDLTVKPYKQVRSGHGDINF